MLSVRSGSVRVYLVLALDQYFNVRRLRLRRAGDGGGEGGDMYMRACVFVCVCLFLFHFKSFPVSDISLFLQSSNTTCQKVTPKQ